LASRPYHHSRLIHLFVCVAILGAIIYIWSWFSDKMLVVLAPSLALGYLAGRADWKRTVRRVDKRNGLILYFSDSVAYALLIFLFLFSKVPFVKFRAIRFLSEYPYILPVIIWFVAAFTVGYNLAFYLGVRKFEAASGPLRIKRFYARSVVGAESMIGKTGTIRQTCEPTGTVMIESTIWNAESIDGSTIPAGDSVIVRDIEGLKVFVEPVQ
jgi:membrane protein implicated in regulation of membrane protease activity